MLPTVHNKNSEMGRAMRNQVDITERQKCNRGKCVSEENFEAKWVSETAGELRKARTARDIKQSDEEVLKKVVRKGTLNTCLEVFPLVCLVPVEHQAYLLLMESNGKWDDRSPGTVHNHD